MPVFAARRIGAALLTMWIAFSLAFFALRLLPGDAIAARLAVSGASEAQIAARRAQLGLDAPPFVQYGAALIGLLHGDLGYSLISGRPVTAMIGESLGPTAALAIGALGVALVIGLGLGAVTTLSRFRLLRMAGGLITALVLAAPIYWLGTLAILLFSLQLRWLPSAGDGSELRFLILPWLALGLASAGGFARLTAALLGETRRADFIRTAHAKGLARRTVFRRHMLRAGAGPLIAFAALQTGFLLGGAAVTEMLFVRRGLGQTLLNAVQDRDFPVVQGLVVLSALVYSTVTTGADLLAAWLDPRLRVSKYAAPE